MSAKQSKENAGIGFPSWMKAWILTSRSKCSALCHATIFGKLGKSEFLEASRQSDSNRRPADYKSAALPAELCRHFLGERPRDAIPKIAQVYTTISAALLKQISRMAVGTATATGHSLRKDDGIPASQKKGSRL